MLRKRKPGIYWSRIFIALLVSMPTPLFWIYFQFYIMQLKPFLNIGRIQMLIALLVSSLLLYTATHKWWYLPSTVLKLHASPVKWISGHSNFIAWTLPALEVAIACTILFPARKKLGFVLSGVLFAAFTAYVIALRSAPPGTVCSCGGFINSLTLTSHLLLVVLAMVLSLMGVLMSMLVSSNASIHKNDIRG